MNKGSPLNRLKVPNIVLVGGTACGKTTVGFQLARLMGFGYLDLDQWIAKKAGKPIAAIFKDSGEEHFRELEYEAVEALGALRNHVIITGAGIVESPKCWDKLKGLGIMVWLATPVENVIARLIMKPDELRKRPLLAGAVAIESKKERELFLRTKLEDMHTLRAPRYKEANMVLADGYATPETGAYLLKSMLMDQGQGSPAGEAVVPLVQA